MSLVDYEFAREDRLLLDANVWLLIYGPRKPSDSRVPLYTDAYRRILEADSRVHVNMLLISEIVNVVVKLRSRLAKSRNLRNFVESPAFSPVAQEAADIIRRIMKRCLPLDDGLAAIPIDNIINDYAQGKHDFNDRVLTYLCKRERLTLITDDAGFRGSDVAILTANRYLF